MSEHDRQMGPDAGQAVGGTCAMRRLNGEHNFYGPTGNCLQCALHYKEVIAQLERQAAENEAAIQDIHLVSIGEMRWLDWGKKHKAAIQRATERADRVTGAA